MRNRLSIAIVCLLASAAAVAQIPGVKDRDAPAASAAPTQAMPFVTKAGASDLYEIQSSQLATQQSQSAKVKSFAGMMIEQHSMTTKECLDEPLPGEMSVNVAQAGQQGEQPAVAEDQYSFPIRSVAVKCDRVK